MITSIFTEYKKLLKPEKDQKEQKDQKDLSGQKETLTVIINQLLIFIEELYN